MYMNFQQKTRADKFLCQKNRKLHKLATNTGNIDGEHYLLCLNILMAVMQNNALTYRFITI